MTTSLTINAISNYFKDTKLYQNINMLMKMVINGLHGIHGVSGHFECLKHVC